MRTIIDLPEPQILALSEICRMRGVSRAEIVRQAVDAFLQEQLVSAESAFGLWKQQQTTEDGLDYQSRMRNDWQ